MHIEVDIPEDMHILESLSRFDQSLEFDSFVYFHLFNKGEKNDNIF